jgi:hypothetical protein
MYAYSSFSFQQLQITLVYSRGLTNAVDPALQERTFKLIQTSVRSQDLVYFFRGFAGNPKAINTLREFFESNYNSVRVCLTSVLVFLCGSR